MASARPQRCSASTPPQTWCVPIRCPESGSRCSSVGWTRWPPSTASHRRSPPAKTGFSSHVEFHHRGRLDATITLHDGRSFGVIRQGLALRRRSLYDRLRTIEEYDYTRRPEATLILTPSVWEQRLTTRFCVNLNLSDCYVAEESRDALERRGLRVRQQTSGIFSGSYDTLDFVSSQGSLSRRFLTEPRSCKRASIPSPERMVQAAPTFGVGPSERRTLDPFCCREGVGNVDRRKEGQPEVDPICWTESGPNQVRVPQLLNRVLRPGFPAYSYQVFLRQPPSDAHATPRLESGTPGPGGVSGCCRSGSRPQGSSWLQPRRHRPHRKPPQTSPSATNAPS